MSILRRTSAKTFANIAYAILAAVGWKKKMVKANLRHVSQGTRYSEVVKSTPQAEHKLYKQMLKNLTRHVGELLFCFDTYKNLPETCTAYPCKIEGMEFEIADGSADVIEKMRKGGIFLTAHYGNYEASGAWLCALGVPLKASFIPLKPAWLNKFVYEKVRCVKGRRYSINAKTPREFIAQLDGQAPDCDRQKQLFCLLADQDSRIASAMNGTFLGQPVKINPLPDFLLRHRPYSPVFFCWIQELGGRKILHAVETFADSKPCGQDSVNSIVDGAYRLWLEERIKENPALWYGWTHRRFKSMNPEIYR